MAPPLTPGRAGLAVALVTLVGGALALNHHLVGIFYDDGLYAGLGWALAHGRGYVYPNLPGTPVAVHYPPLYPLLLAPLFGLLSVPAAALAGKVLGVACAALANGLIAWHAARLQLLGAGTLSWPAAVVVATAALAIPSLTVLTVLLSEPLFALLLAIGVILADRPPDRLPARRAALFAGAAAALSLLVRSIGVAAGVGIVWRVWRGARAEGREIAWRRAALAALPLATAGLSWGLWVLTHQGGIDPLLAPDYGSYFDLLRAAGPGALGGTTADIGRPLGVLTLGWVPGRALYYACGLPALAVGLYGLWCVSLRSSIGPSLLVYLTILACWPVSPDRFLWAVLPWIALVWVSGAVGLWRYAALRFPVAALCLALLWGYAGYELRGFVGGLWEVAGRRISTDFAVVLPALDSLPRDAVIAADNEPLVWLYTGRAAVPRDVYGPPPPVYRAYLERQGVTHLLLAPGRADGARDLERLSAAYPGWLTPIRRWPGGGALFAVRHER